MRRVPRASTSLLSYCIEPAAPGAMSASSSCRPSISAKLTGAKRQDRVGPVHMFLERLMAKLDPHSGHDVLSFPINQMGHKET